MLKASFNDVLVEVDLEAPTLYCALGTGSQQQQQQQVEKSGEEKQKQQEDPLKNYDDRKQKDNNKPTSQAEMDELQKGLCIEFSALLPSFFSSPAAKTSTTKSASPSRTVLLRWNLSRCSNFLRRPVTVVVDFLEKENLKPIKKERIAVPGFIETVSASTKKLSPASSSSSSKTSFSLPAEPKMVWIGRFTILEHTKDLKMRAKLIVANHLALVSSSFAPMTRIFNSVFGSDSGSGSSQGKLFTAICPLPSQSSMLQQKGSLAAKVFAVANDPSGREFEVKNACLVARRNNHSNNSSTSGDQGEKAFRFVEGLDIDEKSKCVELLFSRSSSSGKTNSNVNAIEQQDDEEHDLNSQDEVMEVAVEMELVDPTSMRTIIARSQIGKMIMSPWFLIISFAIVLFSIIANAFLKNWA